jgi:hypothetical protein
MVVNVILKVMNKIINIFLALALFLAVSCKKEPFSCSFINLSHGQVFNFDEDIQVNLSTNAQQGATILLYIDNVCYNGTSDFPYTITIKARDITSGKHLLRAIAQNHEGAQCETSVAITVKFLESPDFVDFAGGVLPVGWETNTWFVVQKNREYLSHIRGPFALYTKTNFATATTKKTCNYVEFFVVGFGKLNFYIDGILWKQIFFDDRPIKSSLDWWTKHEFECPDGLHTFVWEFKTGYDYRSYVCIGDISFKTQ